MEENGEKERRPMNEERCRLLEALLREHCRVSVTEYDERIPASVTVDVPLRVFPKE